VRTAWLPTLGLFLLAPVCAEYLWGYDDSTGHPVTLVGNLLVFSPLYGAPALLIREAARRLGLGWPGLLLLAAAFGVVEAGIVDQSMWSTDYRDIPYWTDMAAPTYLAPIGLSIYLAVSFVGGHVILSIGSPVALVESLSGRRRHRPWLGPVTLVVVALLYVAACVLVAKDAYDTGEATATAWQLAGSAAAAAALAAAAVGFGRRPGLIVPGPVPRPAVVAVAAFLAMVGWTAIPPTRVGTALVVVLAAGVAVTIRRLSLRGDWGQQHVVALASGALVAAGAFAFFTTPIGEVGTGEKYGHNVVLLLLVLALGAAASRRVRRGGPEPAGMSA
jgi:hypothetical protein